MKLEVLRYSQVESTFIRRTSRFRETVPRSEFCEHPLVKCIRCFFFPVSPTWKSELRTMFPELILSAIKKHLWTIRLRISMKTLTLMLLIPAQKIILIERPITPQSYPLNLNQTVFFNNEYLIERVVSIQFKSVNTLDNLKVYLETPRTLNSHAAICPMNLICVLSFVVIHCNHLSKYQTFSLSSFRVHIKFVLSSRGDNNPTTKLYGSTHSVTWYNIFFTKKIK